MVLLTVASAIVVACGTNVDLGGGGGGGAGGEGGSSATCAGFAAPSVVARCKGCTFDCQPNGCYSGWYCKLATKDCRPPCMACGTPGPDCRD